MDWISHAIPVSVPLAMQVYSMLMIGITAVLLAEVQMTEDLYICMFVGLCVIVIPSPKVPPVETGTCP